MGLANPSGPPAAQALVPRADMGIGLCLACCNEHAIGQRQLMPEFAVTTMLVPTPAGIAPVPTCYEHLKSQITAAQKAPLLVGGAAPLPPPGRLGG